ncbi:hypothetical protein HanXRQr2_Chr03g0115741 [Helianthus annuus]|uniref:Uncharacterized protein n=1 Tax=Helianthus annuus TaxID=4232 RepID=A0A9K3JH20_HELAN|nr:hypothetical protein HanXRQr2_Chr03g0115741 [Helianthus annuus]
MHKLDSEGFVMRNPQKMSNEKKKRKKRNGSLKKIKASSFPSNGHNTWHLGLRLHFLPTVTTRGLAYTLDS